MTTSVASKALSIGALLAPVAAAAKVEVRTVMTFTLSRERTVCTALPA